MNIRDCVDVALRHLSPQTRSEFATDPHGAMANVGLTTSAVATLSDRRDEGGACDGVSFLDDGVILYSRTEGSRRENFTLAHELGHWLVERNDDVLDWIADQPDAGKLLETVCDRIAGKLLLPDETVQATVGNPLRAQHVLDLYAASNASIPACAIALTDVMRNLGAIVLIDAETQVVHSSSLNPDPDRGWPGVFPWRGQPVPDGHPLKTLTDGAHTARRTFWRAPWGIEQPYYMDALRQGRRIIAVLSDTDLWGSERLHLDPSREYDRRPSGEVHCCGQTRPVIGWPCSSCSEHFCPECGKCGCDRRTQREVACRRCFANYLPHLIKDGVCVECRS